MGQPAQLTNVGTHRIEIRQPKRLSSLQFFRRYPIFLLAFGPPILRSTSGIDAANGVLDVWAFVQVGWLAMVASRAIIRLTIKESILIPKPIRGILGLIFLLGVVFLSSAVYSTSLPVTAAYSILYLLTLACATEFIADVYNAEIDWMQGIFQLRLVSLVLLSFVVVALIVKPGLVMFYIPGVGVRIFGNAIAPMGLICSVIAIISGYSFLHSLEPRSRSGLLTLAGIGGTISTQARGCEIPLILCFFLLGIQWAKTNQRAAHRFIAGSAIIVLMFGAILAVVGPGRIWSGFNRGGDLRGVKSASGRTEIWSFVVQYCTAHPLGMGYVAGFRQIFRNYYSLDSEIISNHIGNCHNTFMDVLAGAGWLALAIYLAMLTRIVMVAWSYSKARWLSVNGVSSASVHAMRICFLMLVFCLGFGTSTSEFSAALRPAFYFQYIVISMILGLYAVMRRDSRMNRIR